MSLYWIRSSDFRLYLLRQLLPKLHSKQQSPFGNKQKKSRGLSITLPPLIVTVDVPDDSLDENFVFVSSDEGTQSEGSQFGHNNAIRGFIAFEDLNRKKRI